MSSCVNYSKHNNIGIITIDSPPVNALGYAVRQGLLDCFIEANDDNSVVAIVLICDGRTFIAGADISEFDKPLAEPGLHATLDVIEGCSKPVFAAIHGTALGGGLEVALACHYRCAIPSTKLGLPEVHLGLIPGAAGTQRLPRVVGVQQSLKMITSGIPINAEEAHKRGLVDQVIEGDLLDGVIAFAEQVTGENRPLVKVRDLNEKVSGVDMEIFAITREKLAKTRPNFEAPQACVDAVEAACTLTFDKGCEKEGEIFMKLMNSDQSKSQRHIFFAERTAAKITDIPKDTEVKDIQHVAVLGAGTMGGGIAMSLVNAGYQVTLFDNDENGLDRGMGNIRKVYGSSVKKRRLTQEQADACIALITPTVTMDDITDADMVIEAVFENMKIKKEVFRKLDEICKDGCILATNTSTLDVDDIAAQTARPEWVIGMHFFSPAHIMKLLEVVRGDKTNHITLATVMKLAKRIRKVAVVVGVCDGFVGNRMVQPYGDEAMFLAEEGATPLQIDQAVQKWGLAMGPMAMNDLAGLDVSWRIRQGKPKPSGRYSEIPDQICEMGHFGQKTGAGFYKYEDGSRVPVPDPEIDALIEKAANEAGITRRDISDTEIVERLIYSLINAGAKILEDGIAQRASDIDVIYCFGYGFPVYRGGPMFYANTVGLKEVYDRVCAFDAEASDDRWKPATLLKKLAEEGGVFK